MAHGKSQRLRFKRRRNGKTDYRRRLRMLRGGIPRAVVRVSNTQVTCQLVEFRMDGDRVLASITGKGIADKYGWPSDASRKSVPACYVAGYASPSRPWPTATTRQSSTSDSPRRHQGIESSQPSGAWSTQGLTSLTARACCQMMTGSTARTSTNR